MYRRLGFAVAVLAGAAFAPGRAAAGCGDYDTPDLPPELARLVADHGKAPAKPACHGPNCSKPPAAPVSLPNGPVRLPTGGDDLTCPPADAPRVATSSRAHPADHVDGSPARLAAAIYHPPR